ncbi:LAMI_0A04346g1_1 [Lachancea mirantina]|uniref:Pre-mRNA-splicing factor CEF1 n=1 Tax=Lachancea mirantina TaxID=1230905 RepID=A0A1G4INU0_9SACH|nr:LAMI_0A04346g1_1 [Lachancea mirantina]
MPVVPIYVKGGAWTNLEDQILKAAVQKYGTHHWGKTASLLHKKTARQCESRWNEFLNPQLNFDKFSAKEDATLLSLARELPNQWRTIADVLGRTAQICVNRYNELLEQQDSELAVTSSLDFQVGDVNTIAESMPAKPDAAEMDYDDKEMLAEAQARLANTQGKKATRKIRERMLEESKRVAQLQKRRELKQAGIDSKIPAPRKRYATEIDYNADVVYELQPEEGLYDTTLEQETGQRQRARLEAVVDRRGFYSGGESKRQKRQKRDGTGKVSVKASDSAAIDDYKKPKLELPQPRIRSVGHVEKSVESAELIVKPTASLIRNHLEQLFLRLPEPKNDFEIVLDEEDDEKDAEESEAAGENQVQLEEAAENDPSPSTSPYRALQDLLPRPEPVTNATSPVELEYNRILDRGPPVDTDKKLLRQLLPTLTLDVENYQLYMQETQDILAKNPITPRDKIKHQLQQSLQNIQHTQRALRDSEALARENDRISTKLCQTIIPEADRSQTNYALFYAMYQNEYHALQKRIAKWEALASTSSSI